MTETDKVIDYHLTRLHMDSALARLRLADFTDKVAHIESDRNPRAKNKTSSAKGMFQFIDGAIQPAINRTRKALGDADWLAALECRKRITRFGIDKQTALFLGNILEMKGTDRLVKEILATGSTDAMKQLYADKHHTAPDEATLSRMETVFGEGHPPN